MKKPHGWIGDIPLGQGSQARTLCGELLKSVTAVPLDTTDIPVGNAMTLPDWICPKCRKAHKPKPEGIRQFVYAIKEQ